MSRAKHLTVEDAEQLAEAEVYFEPYLAYVRLAEWQGLPILPYGPWRVRWDEQHPTNCRHCRKPYPQGEARCPYCFVPNPQELI